VARDTRVRETLEFARLLWDAYDGNESTYPEGAARLPDPTGQARDMHWAFTTACLAGVVARHRDTGRAEPS
jgi:hypothetical protein